ncbi:hypothetical protein CVT25_008604 [Psilocybe cyanescens]|uniref:Uncharacterized protein n=1 Tax=Psilocybe cyanescens TaxID=93625 RepID=A0A409XLI5_PSICY|nr:hypothetical protein CVT25_008604 [Psilocybe cyanescens]
MNTDCWPTLRARIHTTKKATDPRKERMLLEKRASIRRRSLFGSRMFRSITKGVTTRMTSANASTLRGKEFNEHNTKT